MVERSNKLIAEVKREPFSGIGQPEPLKHAPAGHGSRRIDGDTGWSTGRKTRRR